MKEQFDFDFAEFVDEHKITLVMLGLIVVGAFSWVTSNGSELMARKNAADASKSQNINAQSEAEQLFSDQGCSAQFLNRDTRTTGLTEGAIAVDPTTGTTFNGGLLCSADGSLWDVQQGGVVKYIGTSPKIRNYLIKTGFADKAKQMFDQAQKSGLVH